MKTVKEILADDNMLCSLYFKDYNIKLFLIYIGTNKLQYYMFVNDTILFEGVDYQPSSLYNIDSLESIVGLLSFLCVGIHDTDKEFFKNYTPDQIKWATEYGYREQLSCLVHDFENTDSEYYKNAKKELKKAFNYIMRIF